MAKRMAKGLALALGAMVLATAGCAKGSDPRAAQGPAFDASAFSSPSDMVPVVVNYKDRSLLTKLVNAGMDVHSVNVPGRVARGMMTLAQAELARGMGMKVDVQPKQSQQRVDKGFRNYEQIAARLQELGAKAKAAGFGELVDAGDSWETQQGKAKRDLLALRLGKPGAGKPVVMFVGCHHAREIVTPEIVLMEAEHLVENYGKDAEVTAAIDGREIWIMPMVNPDGHVHALTGDMWRKNANNVTGGKRTVGVDLNRNYDIAWGTVGDSGNPEAETFRGSKAFSEPETQAVRDLVTKAKPVIYLTFHSYANSVMWPWDHQSAPPADKRLPILGAALGKLSGYQAYQGAEMYLNSGDDVDWVHKNLGSLSYTIEIGGWSDGFMPPFSRMPKFWKENAPMMAYALKVADNPVAAAGPQGRVSADRSGLSIQAPGAVKAEIFEGKAGAPGTGRMIDLNGGKATLPAFAGDRRLVFVRPQAANGAWGPTEAVWSK